MRFLSISRLINTIQQPNFTFSKTGIIMKKIFLFALLIFSITTKGQINYSALSIETLENLKNKSANENNFLKAAEIKKEIDFRESELKKINELQIELDKKVKEEDFSSATDIQERIKNLKTNNSKKEELRKQIASAATANDFDKAAQLQTELDVLINKNNQIILSGNYPKAFEGKIDFDKTFQNVPADKIKDYSNYYSVHYYKKNLRRTEDYYKMGGSTKTITRIYNFDKGEFLSLVEIKNSTGAGNMKVATLKKLEIEPTISESFNYQQEFRKIAGYDCQKVNYKFANSKSNLDITAFVYKGFSITGFYGQKIPCIFMDYPSAPVNKNESITTATKLVSISETQISEDYFSTIAPSDYELKDERNISSIAEQPNKSSTNSSMMPCNADGKFELTETGDLLVKGVKIASVKKTKNGNMLSEAMPEFTVYDINGKAWMYFEGNQGKMMFLDDNKSYLPRKCDAHSKSVAEFIASDCIFTEKGFNVNYRDAYIQKNGGYNASAKLTSGERNKSAYIDYIETNILQGGQPIGSYFLIHEPNTEKSIYKISNNSNALIAKITILNSTSLTEYMITIDIDVVDSYGQVKTSKRLSETKSGNVLKDLRIGLNWLVSNGYL